MSQKDESSQAEGQTIQFDHGLVEDHKDWALSIARAVARAWNLDWKSDGLDGAALEALIGCASRYDAERGVPFKSYARRRIHEASCEQARNCSNWNKGIATKSAKQISKSVSVELLHVFPELHDGLLPFTDSDLSNGDVRGAIRNLLVGATILSARESLATALPDDALDFKRLLEYLKMMEPIHQELVFEVYWKGLSLRELAGAWDTDQSNVVREHKVLLAYLCKRLSTKGPLRKPQVRNALRGVALKIKKATPVGCFGVMLSEGNSDEEKGNIKRNKESRRKESN